MVWWRSGHPKHALVLGPRGATFTKPLRQAAAASPLAGLVLAVAGSGLAVPGLTAAGAVFFLRYVLRSRWADLAGGLVLLDAAALLLAVQQGWSQPLAFVAPVGLSALVAAQLLRRTLDLRVVTLMRYAAAAAIYLAALVDAVGTPMWSLVLLQMSLLGMAAGAVLRVRAYLFLGSGFAAAALLTELLRFGLAHSQFWALYLTVLGLLILGFMVLLTLWRQPLGQLRQQFAQVMGEWEGLRREADREGARAPLRFRAAPQAEVARAAARGRAAEGLLSARRTLPRDVG